MHLLFSPYRFLKGDNYRPPMRLREGNVCHSFEGGNRVSLVPGPLMVIGILGVQYPGGRVSGVGYSIWGRVTVSGG